MTFPLRWVLLRLVLVGGLGLTVVADPRAGLASMLHDEVMARTADIRGLEPAVPVPLAFVNPAQLRQVLLDSFEREHQAPETEASRKLLVLLGLLHPDADLRGAQADLYTLLPFTYYERLEKTMYVVGREPALRPGQQLLLAHEYTHALQDQHFDLTSIAASARGNSDRSSAVAALVEGDANLTMIQYLIGLPRPQGAPELPIDDAREHRGSLPGRVPSVISDLAAFSDNVGFIFALALWEYGGFDAINRAFRDPPQSTAQIIHPEKYLAGDQPVEVALPGLTTVLGRSWSELRSDVLGEFGMWMLLREFMDEMSAAQGAAGWRGDRVALLESTDGQQALVISTIWDGEAEAGEFFNFYADSIGREGDAAGRRYGTRAYRIEEIPSKIVWATPSGVLLLEKWGPRVAIVLAPGRAALDSLVAAIGQAEDERQLSASNEEHEQGSRTILVKGNDRR